MAIHKTWKEMVEESISLISGYKKSNSFFTEEVAFPFVRLKGLEPPRLSAPDPKSGVATNYTTDASIMGAKVMLFYKKPNI